MPRGEDLRWGNWRRFAVLSSTLAFNLGSLPSPAADFTLTGFGTIGYAVADRDLQYLRYIDDRGTFKTDSLLGVQAEARFSPQWSATVQAVASASRDRDEGAEAELRWAFVSFRPNNDWLLRVGRIRPAVFVNTQNAEVGVTYDTLRLPAEVYSLSPVYDFDGLAVSKSVLLKNSEVSAEVYWGKTDIRFRDHYQRDPPATYFPERIHTSGVVLSYLSDALLLRGGFHYARLTATGSEHFPRSWRVTIIDAPPPFGGSIYEPASFVREIDVRVFTLGADWRVHDLRITGEYALRRIPESNLLANDQSAYVTIAREVGHWTPYVTYARLLSRSEGRRIFRQINDTPVPLAVQAGPNALPENAHRLFADRLIVNDQYSLMFGASYRFSATSMLKLEWMHTQVGLVSTLVDGEARNKSFNVFSLSYSMAF